MKPRYILSLAGALAISASALEVVNPTVDYAVNPLAVTTMQPRFGWQLKGADGEMQKAYELEVYQKSTSAPLWTLKVTSPESQHIRYSGPELKRMEPYYWRVRVWNEAGQESQWSPSSEFQLAPSAAFLKGDWIGAVSYEQANLPEGRNYTYDKWKKPDVKEAWEAVDSMTNRSIILRKEFDIPRKVEDATAYICGLGHYELTINGRKVGDGEFTPLWSDYDKTVYYNTYDVTGYLRDGENAIGVLLGNGFYNVVRGNRYSKLQIGFGPETLWMKMLVRYTDGTTDTIQTGPSWKYDLSPITFHSMYGGEDYDARLEQPGWNLPGFNDSSWKPVVVQRAPKGRLEPQLAQPVKLMSRFDVKSSHKLTPDEIEKGTKATKRTIDPSAILLDMGQNLSGFPEITVKGKPGQKVTLVVSESITDDNAANQRQTGRQHFYTYTIRSTKPETWHPRFSYYGFRYIQLEGAVLKGMKNPTKLPVVEKIQSCFVHNSAPKGGEFESSSEVLTKAHDLINNAVRSNMQAVFTDCPHREKLGWLEQVHLNGQGLLYNYDLTRYLPKVLRDIHDSQRADGMVPTVAPQYVIFEGPGMDAFAESPEWGATLILSPWQYYENYGDDSLLREYYPDMRRYVDYLTTRGDEDGLIDFGLGDWYDYGDFKAGFSRNTPVGLVASAHYYQDILYLVKTAELLGNTYDAEQYIKLADKVLKAFNKRYYDPAKKSYGSGSQTSNALPLYLDMVPKEDRAKVLESLVSDIKAHGTRLTTGDVGNRYLFRVLADNGLDSLMWAMNDHYDVPGYGFQLQFGATTLTEQWDPRQGSSWNHFMMGQIDEWLFRSLLGVRPDPKQPGMRHMILCPQPVGDLTSASGKVATLYGDVRLSWTKKDGVFTYDVDLPANTSATVYLPGETEPVEIKSGHHKLTSKI